MVEMTRKFAGTQSFRTKLIATAKKISCVTKFKIYVMGKMDAALQLKMASYFAKGRVFALTFLNT